MTKKDYELIAKTFYDQLHNANWNDERKLGIKILSDALADSLEYENPRFDRNKFLQACGINEIYTDTGKRVPDSF